MPARGRAVFRARTRGARLAETVTQFGETGVPDEASQAATLQFSDKELADLTIAIALMNAYNRLAISFRTPALAATRS
jgi:alkylhydroperoxidase family enzyme